MIRLVAISLAAAFAMAQNKEAPKPAGSWNRVMPVQQGAATKVKTQGARKEISGKFAGASEDAIQIHERGRVTSIPKAEVERVSVARKKIGRYALLGAAMGGGVGAGVLGGYAAIGQRKDADDDYRGIFAFVGLVIGSGAGAATGALSGSGYATVYSR
ncbi:MAG: hypothetical protein FJW39_21370 [Acidobacteria bacterium]|nr:hypothetical protein [Acidobacteriota bacterium]